MRSAAEIEHVIDRLLVSASQRRPGTMCPDECFRAIALLFWVLGKDLNSVEQEVAARQEYILCSSADSSKRGS